MTKSDKKKQARIKAKMLGVTRTGVKKHINKNIGLKASQDVVDEIIVRNPSNNFTTFDKNINIIAKAVGQKGKKTIKKKDLDEIYSAQLWR